MSAVKTHYRACHLCEAICGLEIKTEGSRILSIKGDHDDPFSRGHICPKAVALQDIHDDPDRLRWPVKKVNGEWQQISWEQAFQEVSELIVALQSKHGNDALGVYAGNPNVHNYGNLTHGKILRKALGTKNNFSATSLDQLPHHITALNMFGHQFLIPVPDIDHTDLMIIIGGNPIASNGSMMTVPDVKNRLKAIQQRGGQFVVIDPRRTETAELADKHLFIRPGSDAYLLLAMLNCLFRNNLVNAGHLSQLLNDYAKLPDLLAPFTIELAEQRTGIAAQTISDLLDQFIETPKAVLYGRMGVSVQRHGALCQWAIHVLNLLAGKLDVVGGALFPGSAVAYVKPGEPGAGHFNLYQSRVSGLPEFSGEFPSTILAEEMETPGDGQIKAMITLAGNPVISAPNGRRLEKAFANLDLMVALDIYINETTCHADYILPPTGPLEHDHYDVAFHRLAVRNTARFNEPVFEREEGALHDWEILNGLSLAISELKGLGLKTIPAPDMLMDFALQSGPYGVARKHELGLSLAMLKANPHGIDIGPLQPSLPERLCTEDKQITVIWRDIEEDIQRLMTATDIDPNALLLIGRRHVRTNNSWMNNAHRLVKGKPRWQCLMHPLDMQSRQIKDGAEIVIRSRVGEVTTLVQSSEEMMPGVISIPHGWGQKRKGVKLQIATQQDGVSVNDLTDDGYFDQLSGNAVLNGVPVNVSPV